jgi:hypothetical protein
MRESVGIPQVRQPTVNLGHVAEELVITMVSVANHWTESTPPEDPMQESERPLE